MWITQAAASMSSGTFSQPCRATCPSKAAVQRGLSPSIPEFRVVERSLSLSLIVPKHRGGEGFLSQDNPETLAALPHARL
jgi:hypothetical protein